MSYTISTEMFVMIIKMTDGFTRTRFLTVNSNYYCLEIVHLIVNLIINVIYLLIMTLALTKTITINHVVSRKHRESTVILH